MMQLIIRFIVNAIVLFLIAKFVPGFNHDIGIGTALIAAVVFGLVNALIGPILRLITLPLNWITHGLFAIVVNFVLFWLTVLIAPNFKATGEINPWLAYLIGAVIMMIVATVMQSVAKTDQEATVSDSP
jgi:putative membrane protein